MTRGSGYEMGVMRRFFFLKKKRGRARKAREEGRGMEQILRSQREAHTAEVSLKKGGVTLLILGGGR